MKPRPCTLVIADAAPQLLLTLKQLRGATCRPWLKAAEPFPETADAVVWSQVLPCDLDDIRRRAGQGVTQILGGAAALSNEQLASLSDGDAARLGLLAPLRGSAYFDAARDVVASGRLGRLGLVRYHEWHDDCLSIEDGIDLVCALLGQVPQTIYATRAQLSGSSSCDTEPLMIHLGFTGGAMAIVDWHRHERFRTSPYESLCLIGSQGAFYADDHDNVQLMYGSRLEAMPTVQRSTALRTQLQAWLHERISAACAEATRAEVRNAEVTSETQSTALDRNAPVSIEHPWQPPRALQRVSEARMARQIAAIAERCCQLGTVACRDESGEYVDVN